MSAHDTCVVCLGDISVLDFTVNIGDCEAHDSCAHDRSLVAKCDCCGALGVREGGITGWGRHELDELCQLCLADRLAEVAAEREEAERLAAEHHPMRDAS